MTTPVLVRDLTKTYGSHVGVDGINLSVEAGEIVGFLGANGAGKTTTLRCLVGLLKPTSGSVRVVGCDPLANHKEAMTKIGYLPGELRLYEDLTGVQHLELLARLQGVVVSRQRELCERLELSEGDLKRPIRDYSRGMKQKVGLIQAFQHEPSLVLLDEPTEGLDPIVQQSFFTLLADEQQRGCTVLLSSHVMSEVQRTCERVAIIKSGRLVATDQVESLRQALTRRMRLKFTPEFDKANIPLDETMLPRWNENELVLSIDSEQVVKVLREMLAYPVIDVVVEEASLDDAILNAYGRLQA